MDGIYNDILSEDEARQVTPIMQDLLETVGHAENTEEISSVLSDKFRTYLPDKSEEEISGYVRTITDTLQSNSDRLASLDAAKQHGTSREAWFADSTMKVASQYGVDRTLSYYAKLSETIQQSNEQMYNVIMTNSGSVNMNPNLDGLMAEQHHVQSFNMDAAAKGSNLRAEIVSHDGEAYTKNGVDIVIRDVKKNKIVKRYQAKYYKDSNATELALKHGDYRGQQALVPKDQLEEITSNGRKATDVISCDNIKSEPLSKTEAKQMQESAQKGEIQQVSFDDYKMKDLAKGVGKQAVSAAMMGAAITTGFVIAEKVVKGEEITADEIIETAVITGADAGVKAAVSGSLVIASEKGMLSVIPKGTPAEFAATVAFIAVENAKVLVKVANGEMSATAGLSRMMDVTFSAVTGLAVSFVACAEIGVAVGLALFPAVGIVAGLAAGVIGYAAGTKLGQTISKGAKAVGKAAVKAVKAVGKAAIATGKVICNAAKSVASAAKSVFGGFFRR